MDEIWELAQNRRVWKRRTEDLAAELEPHDMYVPVWSARWEAARKACKTLHDLQFVEEGKKPFPWTGDEIHAYSDGSHLQDGEKTDRHRHACGYATIPLSNSGTFPSVCAPLLAARDQTNNRAEICGAIASARIGIVPQRPVWNHTDSGVVWYWYHFQRIPLRLVRYAPLLNTDLWLEFDAVLQRLPSHGCIKVRSHNGNPWNDEADLVAGLAAHTSSMLRYPGLLTLSTRFVGGTYRLRGAQRQKNSVF